MKEYRTILVKNVATLWAPFPFAASAYDKN